MRVLVIAPQPFFTPRGTPFSVYYRAMIMSELGAEIDLITYGEGEDPDIPNVRIFRGPRFAWLGNVRTGPSMLKLFLDVFVAGRTVWMLTTRRYDVVHAHEEGVFICRFLKPIFRFKLIYDMHSSLTQQLTNFDYTDSRLIHYIFKKLENSSINAAEAVITICPDLADYVNHIITDESKHYLIENSIFDPVRLKGDIPGADTAQAPVDTAGLPSNQFRFVYTGTLEFYQGIELLIDAFAKVSEQKSDAVILIVGGTEAQVETYRKRAHSKGLQDRCHFTGTVPQRQATRYMESANVLLSPRTEGTNTPLKIYQQLASGIPVVATNIYSHTQVLSNDVAFLADPEPAAFAAAMIAAMSEADTAGVKVANALRLYEEKYSRESYVRKLRALLDGLR